MEYFATFSNTKRAAPDEEVSTAADLLTEASKC
jgi:hypothetical protein